MTGCRIRGSILSDLRITNSSTRASTKPGGSGVGANIPCQPDSDANIYDSSNPNDAHFIGKHPGTAFMEMQFYPAGMGFYFTGSGSPTQWSSALNIDSLSMNANTGQLNNAACNAAAGEEYVNFAWITKSGVPVERLSMLSAEDRSEEHTSELQSRVDLVC